MYKQILDGRCIKNYVHKFLSHLYLSSYPIFGTNFNPIDEVVNIAAFFKDDSQ